MTDERSAEQIAADFWATRGGRPEPGADLKKFAKDTIHHRFWQPEHEARKRKAERIKLLNRARSERMKAISRVGNGMDIDVSLGDDIRIGPRGGRYRINSNGRKSYDVR